MLMARAEADELEHFGYRPDALAAAADYVIDTIRHAYPTLDIPYHARWRHFVVDGRDRWAVLANRCSDVDRDEIARIRIDLAVTSVLLDAGAGADWRYRDSVSGRELARSEGLAIASFDMFAGGTFSADPDRPLRADAEALESVSDSDLAKGFQAGPDNPLVGIEGRASLVRQLGRALRGNPEHFGAAQPRIGNLFDYLQARANGGSLPAVDILTSVLTGLGEIWPGRVELDDINLGDVWRHPAAAADDVTDGLVPFHKLSQWLTYSLIEPLEEAGLTVSGLDALTGLAEYRNGGLFLDTGVLVPKHQAVIEQAHRPGDVVIVEWRALTIALLDRLAVDVRTKLGLDDKAFPLAKVLEGGSWGAGRRIAAERRPDGAPPIRLESDGTVF